MANRWFVRNFAVINLVLVIFCIISYVATIYSLEFWTYRRWSDGEFGGVLDYRWLGISVVHHVVQEDLETVFSFPDYTSYFLIVFIIFNLATLFLSRDSDTTRQYWIHIRNSTILNVIVAILCEVFYARWTMTYIDLHLRFTQPIGGAVQYVPTFIIAITHVYQGDFESSLNWRIFDIVLWLLLVLLVQGVRTIRWKMKIDRFLIADMVLFIVYLQGILLPFWVAPVSEIQTGKAVNPIVANGLITLSGILFAFLTATAIRRKVPTIIYLMLCINFFLFYNVAYNLFWDAFKGDSFLDSWIWAMASLFSNVGTAGAIIFLTRIRQLRKREEPG